MPVPSSALVEISGLSKRFGGLLAVDGVHFSIYDKHITALIGPNGAGKTTVFNCLTGFYRPSGGKITAHFKGSEVNLAKLTPDQVAGLTSECFDMRFERTALYAHENGFPLFTSCLGISRWKNMEQINGCGHRAAARYEGLEYWDYNWRKRGGAERMIEISKREEFYQQEYCGCIYSLRDTNKRRRDHGEPNIQIGVKYYGKDSS